LRRISGSKLFQLAPGASFLVVCPTGSPVGAATPGPSWAPSGLPVPAPRRCLCSCGRCRRNWRRTSGREGEQHCGARHPGREQCRLPRNFLRAGNRTRCMTRRHISDGYGSRWRTNVGGKRQRGKSTQQRDGRWGEVASQRPRQRRRREGIRCIHIQGDATSVNVTGTSAQTARRGVTTSNGKLGSDSEGVIRDMEEHRQGGHTSPGAVAIRRQDRVAERSVTMAQEGNNGKEPQESRGQPPCPEATATCPWQDRLAERGRVQERAHGRDPRV
jgi:hypothetical protein